MVHLTTIMLVSTTWVVIAGGPLISLWETTCKVHADSRHEEMKGLLQKQHLFSFSNWSHVILLSIMIILCVITIAGCCFIWHSVSPTLKVAKKVREANQLVKAHSFRNQSYQAPYNANTPFQDEEYKTYCLKEISPPTNLAIKYKNKLTSNNNTDFAE